MSDELMSDELMSDDLLWRQLKTLPARVIFWK